MNKVMRPVLALVLLGILAAGLFNSGAANAHVAVPPDAPSGPPARPLVQQFQDVPDNHPYAVYINCVATAGWITGYPCGGAGEPCVPPANLPYFRPTPLYPNTRGDIAQAIALGAGYNDPVASTTQSFEDVPPSNANWLAIERALLHGIVAGYGCGGAGEPCVPPGNRPYFRPNTPGTRALFAKMIAQAAGFNDTPSGQTFADVPVGNPFYIWIERVALHGVMDGYPCGGAGEPCPGTYFRPNTNLDLSRAQMAQALARAFLPGCAPYTTPTPTVTGTPPGATATATPLGPTPTRTSTPTLFPMTATPLGPTATRTSTPLNTATRTAVPSATPPPGASATPTAPPPNTATRTRTPTPPLNTATRTPVPPSTTPPPATSTPSATGTALPCITPQPTATATPVCTITFNDVPPTNPFYSFIQCLACRGIISGYTCGGPGEPCPGIYFRPNGNLTRGQLAKILTLAADMDATIPATQQTFEDVPPTHPFWLYSERLVGVGAISGYGCGGPGEPCVPPANRPYFRPYANVTRGQASKIASLGANLTDPVGAGQQSFADVPPTQPFYIWVEQMAGRGIISGYGCGGPGEPCVPPGNLPYFRPFANVTRGQASKIVANLFSPNCQPVVPGGPSGSELLGGGNPTQGSNTGSGGLRVNTATGNFSYEHLDFAIPGRGPGLGLTRTYNALAASIDSPFGYGWTNTYNQFIVGTVNPVVYQENGSTAPFQGAGPVYTHDPRVLADLVYNGGLYTLTRYPCWLRYIYNIQGRLTQIVDRNNYGTSLSYNGVGQVTAVTDSANRQILFTYNGTHISRVDDPSGNRHITYSYDGAGNLITAADVGGSLTQFTYDNNHHMLSAIATNGGVLSNTFDAAGRVIAQIGPLCRVYSFAYQTTGNHVITTITDFNGIVTSQTHTSNRLTKVVEDALGPQPATSTYTYGGGYVSGQTTATDQLGHTWRTTFDAHGNPLTRTDPLGRVSTFTYGQPYDVLLTATNPLNVTTTSTYDGNSNPLSISRPLIGGGQTATTLYTYDPGHPGDVLTTTDPLGHATRTDHNPLTGDVVTTTNALGERSSTSYDAVGRPLVAILPLGQRIITTYNAYGDPLSVTDAMNVTTYNTYDNSRNLVAVQDGNGRITTTTYDLANQPVRVTQPDGTHTDTAYDALGNITSEINSLGQITYYYYNRFYCRYYYRDMLQRVTLYNRNAAGRVTSMVDSSSPPRTTTYTYNDANELTNVAYSDGTTPNVTYSYDGLGRRTAMTDGTGTTTDTYDSLDRLTQERNGANQVSTYTYDLDGNMLTVGYPGGNTVVQTYDAANRLVTVRDWLNNTTSFLHDLNGNLTAKIYPNGTRVDQTYNANSLLTGLVHSHTGTTFLGLTYTRDAVGQVSGVIDSVTGPRTYQNDLLNRLTSDSGGPSDSRTWGYDGAYQITGTTTLSNGTQLTTVRSYDAGNQLLSLTETQGGSPTPTSTPIITPTPCPGSQVNGTINTNDPTQSGRLASSGVPSLCGAPNACNTIAGTYHYDLLGPYVNTSGAAICITVTLTTACTGTNAIFSGAYFGSFDPNNICANHAGNSGLSPNGAPVMYGFNVPAGATFYINVAEVTANAGCAAYTVNIAGLPGCSMAPAPPVIPTDRTVTYGYNGVGDRTSQSDSSSGLTTYAYDQESRLGGYSHGGTSASYAYNGDGLRMGKTVGATTQQFAWSSVGGLPLLLTDGLGQYIYGPDGALLEEIVAGAPYYYHADQLGSTRALTNQAGNVVATTNYDPYGTILSSTGNVSNPFGYSGEYRDGESGLIYLRARYYDPATQIFLTRDPLIRWWGWKYCWCHNWWSRPWWGGWNYRCCWPWWGGWQPWWQWNWWGGWNSWCCQPWWGGWRYNCCWNYGWYWGGGWNYGGWNYGWPWWGGWNYRCCWNYGWPWWGGWNYGCCWNYGWSWWHWNYGCCWNYGWRGPIIDSWPVVANGGPYAYVAGNPLNATDPSGMMPKWVMEQERLFSEYIRRVQLLFRLFHGQ